MLYTKLTKTAVIGLSALTLSVMAAPEARATNLVQNGGFEITTGLNGNTTGSGELTFNINATGWTISNPGTALNLIIGPGVADTTGVTTRFGTNDFNLWGPGRGGGNRNNGLPATSPAGGNYLAADGDVNLRGAISQVINGLTIGQMYQVSFWEAAGQQEGFRGDTTSQWQVSFGTQTRNGTLFNNPDRGFQPWRQTNLLFTATSTTQTLSFLAIGTPSGLPPFSLLDGVSVTAVPEGPSLLGALAALGLGIGFKVKLAKKKSKKDEV